MDFLSIRKKAKERAEARARAEAKAAETPPSVPSPAPPAALVPPAATPPAPHADDPLWVPGAPEASPLGLLAALRAELQSIAGQAPAPDPAPQVAPPTQPGPPTRPAPPALPFDPLDEFFWREDEEAPALPDLGLGAGPGSGGSAAPAERREFVTFLLGAEEYALAIERVREILKPPPIAEVPRAPAHVLGVVTVRGEVVTVVDPRPRLALPPAAPGSRGARILLCDAADGPAGLLVDAVSQVVRLAPRPSSRAPPASAAPRGRGRRHRPGRGRLFILLDLDALLPASGGAA
jgi:purine-binding chemotaxis protein CheW